MKLKNISFTRWLSIVSIIGFVSILVGALFNYDFQGWQSGLLFMIIGLALFVQGGSKFFAYFKNGLTPSEINRMVTVIVGVASFITGVLILPVFGFEILILNGIKAIIAVIAIAVITIEEFWG